MTTVNGAPRLLGVDQRPDAVRLREDEKVARKAALIRANTRGKISGRAGTADKGNSVARSVLASGGRRRVEEQH